MPAPPHFFPGVKSHPDPAAGGYPQEFIFLNLKRFQTDIEKRIRTWEKDAAFLAGSRKVEHFVPNPNIHVKLFTIS